jgi:hypothetical protein
MENPKHPLGWVGDYPADVTKPTEEQPKAPLTPNLYPEDPEVVDKGQAL